MSYDDFDTGYSDWASEYALVADFIIPLDSEYAGVYFVAYGMNAYESVNDSYMMIF